MQKWDWMRGSSDISSLFNQKVNKTPQELPADVMLIVNHPEYRGVHNMTRAINTMRQTWNWRKACEMVINTPETLLDMRIYNSLVSDCAKENTTILGVSLVASMRKAGATPDIVTYGNLIQGYANERNLEKAMQVYEFEKKLGLEPGLPTTKIFAKSADNNFPAEGKYFDMIISSCAKAKKMKNVAKGLP
jgi:pentatricopeptide repeat protein